MKIAVARRHIILADGIPAPTYSGSIVRALKTLGHEVTEVLKGTGDTYERFDLLLDIDCGRDEQGKLEWAGPSALCKSAVLFIDSHGYPSLHKRLATGYDHVFFAVWDKRDLFIKHKSAHWCPNFTDKAWFDGGSSHIEALVPYLHFGFFGSKGGLERAKPFRKVCEKNSWSIDIREVVRGNKRRWPATAEAMAKCQVLMNHGQKHDCPNLRVMESMAMKRPLITCTDPRSGMAKLFNEWEHFIPYEAYTYKGLEEAMAFTMDNRNKSADIAERAYREVMANHLVENRVEQILEVVNG